MSATLLLAVSAGEVGSSSLSLPSLLLLSLLEKHRSLSSALLLLSPLQCL
jgi:hypothetical protein